MSRAIRVGIICEGSTDFPVLREVLRAVATVDEFVLLQPSFDRLKPPTPGHPAPGWQGVRKFLQESGHVLDIGGFDVVVVHVDADICHLKEVLEQLSAEEGDEPSGLDALCRLVRSWIAGGVSKAVVVVLPREATETWLLAAHTRRKRVETIRNPAQVMVQVGLLMERNGKPHKTSYRYEQLANPLSQLVNSSQKLRDIPELERFVAKVRARTRVVRKKS